MLGAAAMNLGELTARVFCMMLGHQWRVASRDGDPDRKAFMPRTATRRQCRRCDRIEVKR